MIKRRDNKIVPMTIEDKKLPDSSYYIENNKLNVDLLISEGLVFETEREE